MPGGSGTRPRADRPRALPALPGLLWPTPAQWRMAQSVGLQRADWIHGVAEGPEGRRVIGDVQVLQSVHTVLVVDWPSGDVPDTLARAGFEVTVHGGPGPEDYSVYEYADGEVQVRHVGVAPAQVDLVYAHRPMAELPGIIATAQTLRAKTIWLQSGLTSSGTPDHRGCWVPQEDSRTARELAEAAGLAYLDEPYIADEVRHMIGSG